MALPIDHLNALQFEIINLEFKKEIFLNSKAQIGNVYKICHEMKACKAQISELHGHLDQLISSEPKTEPLGIASAIGNQQTR